MKSEKARLQELRELSIMDTLPEREYDEITQIASSICGTPISLITLLDEERQWFKSKVGLDVPQTPRDIAFCNHAIETPQEIFEVIDARQDDRFKSNPLVTGDPDIVFYTGVPLVTADGNALGTLCVIDKKPKQLNDEQKQSLRALANQVMRLFELRKKQIELEQTKKILEQRSEELQKFAHVAAHDLKSPLANITMLTDMLKETNGDKIDDQGKEIIEMLQITSASLRTLIDGILSHAKNDHLVHKEAKNIKLKDYFKSIAELIPLNDRQFIHFYSASDSIEINTHAITQILLNLIVNGLKYNESAAPIVNVTHQRNAYQDIFVVSDNGIGIAPENHDRIFEIFESSEDIDKYGNKGAGVGLSTVKNLVIKLKGSISIESQLGQGTSISVMLPY